MSEKNPWTTISTKSIYSNPWISVREDKVIRPDGKQGIYGVVEARIATGVLALTEHNELILVGQYRYPIDRYSWEIVEGGVEHGEDILEGIKRELKEEAGLEAAQWRQLGKEMHLSNCFTDERAYLFVAQNLSKVESDPDGTEVLKLRKLPLAECVEMVASGEISDALSIIGILTLAREMGI